MPDEIRWNYPAWLDPYLKAVFGDQLGREMAALGGAAALDLRVNSLRGERLPAKLALEREGVAAEETRYSPLGLRVFERIPLATLEVFRDGRIEVQDEGSQLAALLADAQPGMRVVDFCAGAGGKTLALAAISSLATSRRSGSNARPSACAARASASCSAAPSPTSATNG
jgi:16S rRNA (cytosine967-C5)-methyltransferase